MSRSNYSDDCENLALYRGNVERSIRSKDGQARLRELRDALLSLSVKSLEATIFAEPAPDGPKVCALGAWALAQAGGDVMAAKAMVPDEADDYATATALKRFGWPKLLVAEAIYENDEGHYFDRNQTPEARYDRILRWVESNILPPTPAQETER